MGLSGTGGVGILNALQGLEPEGEDFPYLLGADEGRAGEGELWRLRLEVQGLGKGSRLPVRLAATPAEGQEGPGVVLTWTLEEQDPPEPTRNLALSILAAHGPLNPARTLFVPEDGHGRVRHELTVVVPAGRERDFESSQFQGLALRWLWCRMALFRSNYNSFDRTLPEREQSDLKDRINEKLGPLIRTRPGPWARAFKPVSLERLRDLLDGLMGIPALDLTARAEIETGPWPRVVKKVKGPEEKDWVLFLETGDAPFTARLVISPLVTLSGGAGASDSLLQELVKDTYWGRFGRARLEVGPADGEPYYQGVSEYVLPPSDHADPAGGSLFQECVREVLKAAFSVDHIQSQDALERAADVLDRDVEEVLGRRSKESRALLGSG